MSRAVLESQPSRTGCCWLSRKRCHDGTLFSPPSSPPPYRTDKAHAGPTNGLAGSPTTLIFVTADCAYMHMHMH